MLFESPRNVHPDFARPGVKPKGRAKIRRGHWMAKGLSNCYLTGTGRDLNLARNTGFLEYSTIADGYTFGPMKGAIAATCYTAATGNNNIETNDDSFLSTELGHTYLFSGIFDNTSTPDVYFLPQAFQTSGIRARIRDVGALGTDHRIEHVNYQAAAEQGTDVTLTGCPSGELLTVLFGTDENGNMYVAANGKDFGVHTASATAPAAGALDLSLIFSQWGNGPDGPVYAIMKWDRGFSAPERIAATRDPYQVVEPIAPLTYFMPEAVGGFNPAWATSASKTIGFM